MKYSLFDLHVFHELINQLICKLQNLLRLTTTVMEFGNTCMDCYPLGRMCSNEINFYCDLIHRMRVVRFQGIYSQKIVRLIVEVSLT